MGNTQSDLRFRLRPSLFHIHHSHIPSQRVLAVVAFTGEICAHIGISGDEDKTQLGEEFGKFGASAQSSSPATTESNLR